MFCFVLRLRLGLGSALAYYGKCVVFVGVFIALLI